MGFKESKKFSLSSIAKEIEDFWAKNDVFIKSSNRNNRESFVFFEGPPSANGKPGIHHVMARTIKDAFCRYIRSSNVRVNYIFCSSNMSGNYCTKTSN